MKTQMKTVFAFLAGAVLAMVLMFPMVGQSKEKHPEIEAALAHLKEAKANLKQGSHDFGGHRGKAIEATDTAIQECNQALAYDQK